MFIILLTTLYLLHKVMRLIFHRFYLFIKFCIAAHIGSISSSYTRFPCQDIYEPKSSCAGPYSTKITQSVKQSHICSTHCRITYASKECHCRNKHAVCRYLRKWKSLPRVILVDSWKKEMLKGVCFRKTYWRKVQRARRERGEG